MVDLRRMLEYRPTKCMNKSTSRRPASFLLPPIFAFLSRECRGDTFTLSWGGYGILARVAQTFCAGFGEAPLASYVVTFH